MERGVCSRFLHYGFYGHLTNQGIEPSLFTLGLQASFTLAQARAEESRQMDLQILRDYLSSITITVW